MKKISIGIADDHNLFCEGIRMIVSEMSDMTFTLMASDGEDLLNQLRSLESAPDVILLDIEMGGTNGIEALKKIREQKPDIKVIILSMHTEPAMVYRLMKLGANGYLKKDVGKKELETAIRDVCTKGFYINDHISSSLIMELRNTSKSPSFFVQLTAREKEVLTLICEEYTTQEIGEKLFISDRTVEGHRKNLCIKLDVKNTAGLVKKALILKLVDSSGLERL